MFKAHISECVLQRKKFDLLLGIEEPDKYERLTALNIDLQVIENVGDLVL